MYETLFFSENYKYGDDVKFEVIFDKFKVYRICI
jgi:hypothetical protein